ncbi:GntR family transcriptional regulator, partial [Streptomyces klenkii]
MQITDHYRREISDGDLPEGAKLPTVVEISKTWGVAHATAAKAIAQLQVEGLISTSPRGSFVAGKAARALSPHDRLSRLRRTGDGTTVNEQHEVTAAEVIDAPAYVADLLDLDPGAQVIRREYITSGTDASGPRSLSVTWYPARLADAVPTLLSTDAAHVGTVLADVQAAV